MKVLLINGSPNEKGSTWTILSEIAGSLEKEKISTEIVYLGAKPITDCIGCRKCSELKKCVFDDIVNEIAQKAAKSDGFIFGSPVYYASATGRLTSVMDRLFFSAREVLRYKPAAAAVVARRAGNTAALDRLNKYFSINCMPIVSSKYWNMAHGHNGQEVKQDLEGMQTMRLLGKNMAWLLKSIEAGRAAGISIPDLGEKEEITNFIR
jgi:multimeric flavodoxin WrbA